MITFPTSIYAALRYKVGLFFQEKTASDHIVLANPEPILAVGLRSLDTVPLADSFTISYTQPFTDAAQLTDAISLLFAGGVSFNDTAAMSDTGLLRIQDYCDFSYFEADYVGTSSTF